MYLDMKSFLSINNMTQNQDLLSIRGIYHEKCLEVSYTIFNWISLVEQVK